MSSLKAWGVSSIVDMTDLMGFVTQHCSTADILDYIGRKEVMREIEASDFVDYKGDSEILSCIDVREAMSYFNLVQKETP